MSDAQHGEVFYIRSKRWKRKERATAVQHLGAAIMLIATGWTHLTSHVAHHDSMVFALLPYAEIAAGATLIASNIVERVRHRRGHHSSIGWVEIAGALMTLIEAVARLYEPHTLALRIASFVPVPVLFILGLLHVRMQQRYYWKSDDDAFESRMRWSRAVRVAWPTIAGYRVEARQLELLRHDGSVQIVPLRDVDNRDEALQWLHDALGRRGVARAS